MVRLAFLLLLAVLVGSASAQEEPGEPALGHRVNHSITWGVHALFERQDKDGGWEAPYEARFPGGLTAFVCFTLIKSGVSKNDPRLVHALEKLAEVRPKSTYGAAARLFLYRALGRSQETVRDAEYAANLLLADQREGLWGYPDDPLDMSNTQFALLGLHAAHEMGIEIPEGALLDCLKALLQLQSEGGAFRYKSDHLATLGMTAATLAGFATLDRFAESMGKLNTGLRRAESARQRAATWIEDVFDPARNAMEGGRWTPSFRLATLWAIERYADLSGLERVGEHDWYAEGAEWLLATQNVDGNWGRKTYQTCFALLFLRRSSFSGPKPTKLLEQLDERFQPRPVARTKPASGVPYVDQWLVAGPWIGERGATGLAELPFRVDKVKVAPKRKVGRKKLRVAEFKRAGVTNLEPLVNPPPNPGSREGWVPRDHQLVVVATKLVHNEADAVAARLWFTFEDGWRVYLNGEEISRGERVSAPPPLKEDVFVDVQLAPGETSLVVVVEDVYASFPFGCRVTSPTGTPLANVSANYD